MLVFKSLEELKPYYNEYSNLYAFNDDVTFEFDLDVRSNIKALNIYAFEITAWDINAWNINAHNIVARDINAGKIKALNIDAWDINAGNINAGNISYYAVCFAYYDITCTSIQGHRSNHKHFALDGEITIKPKAQPKKTVTLELTDEQLAKIKEIV